jgi:hypothetical protein
MVTVVLMVVEGSKWRSVTQLGHAVGQPGPSTKATGPAGCSHVLALPCPALLFSQIVAHLTADWPASFVRLRSAVVAAQVRTACTGCRYDAIYCRLAVAALAVPEHACLAAGSSPAHLLKQLKVSLCPRFPAPCIRPSCRRTC